MSKNYAAHQLAVALDREEVRHLKLPVKQIATKPQRNYVIGKTSFKEAFDHVFMRLKIWEVIPTSEFMLRMKKAGWNGGQGALTNLHIHLRKCVKNGWLRRTRSGRYAYWSLT